MSEKGEKSGSKKEERYERGGNESPDSRYNPENIRTGSRYDPENIKTGSRYDRGVVPEAPGGMAGYMDLVRARDPLAILSAVLGILLLAGYLAGAVFFANHFYPGTTILGINCAAKQSSWVKEQVEQRVEEHSLVLRERYGVTEQLAAQSIGLHYVDDGAIDRQMRAQLSAFWPVMMLARRGTPVEIRTEYDAGRVRGALLELGCFRRENVIEPQDACVGETDDGYQVVPEEMGTQLDIDKTVEAVKDALDAEESEVILEFKECYVDPQVYADDENLLQEVKLRNDLLGADLTYDFIDRREKVDTQQIMAFMEEDGRGGYRISEDAVYHYVNVLADQYDTYGGTRTFYSSVGTVETLYGGDYGWAMDRDSTAAELLRAIREKKTGTIEPVYMYTARDRSTNDIGSTYVEICIKQQTMWCYKDGELVVETPVVTGNPSKGNATPSGGVWAIDAKQQKAILVGEGYRQPVDYWMPFNGNIGIHDLQSRYWFGSTIYLTNGSHGCVNTPLEAVRQIYETVDVGTPVVVYEGE